MRALAFVALLSLPLLAGCSGPEAAAPPEPPGSPPATPDDRLSRAYEPQEPQPEGPRLQTLEEGFWWTAGVGSGGRDAQVETSDGIIFDVTKAGKLVFDVTWTCATPDPLCTVGAALCVFDRSPPFPRFETCPRVGEGTSPLHIEADAPALGFTGLTLSAEGAEGGVDGTIVLQGYVEPHY